MVYRSSVQRICAVTDDMMDCWLFSAIWSGLEVFRAIPGSAEIRGSLAAAGEV